MMRRRAFLGALLALAGTAAQAQLVSPNAPTLAYREGLSAPALAPEATAWRAAVVAAGGTVSDARLALVSTLINDMKAGGAWANLDRLWLFAGENTQSALLDIVALVTATSTAMPVFTTDRGYKGNGTTQYVDSGFRWDTAGGKYTQNDASFGVFIETAPTGSSMGFVGNEDGSYGRLKKTGATTREGSVNSIAGSGTWNPASQLGFAHTQRISASAGENYGAAGTVEQSWSTASQNTGHRNAYFLAINYTPAAAYSDGRISAGWIGKSMTAPQALALRNALRTYMTAVGIP